MRKTTILNVLLIVAAFGGSCDAAAQGSNADLNGDQVVDWRDFQILANDWLHDFSPPVRVKWMGHASVKIWMEELIVYVDPVESLQDAVPDVSLVLITHSHGDHLSSSAINRVSGPNTALLGPPDGPFTVSVWVRGGAPGQVILSSVRGPSWLLLDPETGALRTDLGSVGRGGSPLVSDMAVSDGAW